MSMLLEFALLLIGPILSLCVLMLVAVVWRKVLASERETSRRFIAIEERISRLHQPASLPSAPRLVQGGTSPTAPRRIDQPRAFAGEATPPANLISVPNLAVSGVAHVSPESDLNQRCASVWDLAEAGASAEAIARTTGHPIGEIELILGLKRQSETINGGLRLSGSP